MYCKECGRKLPDGALMCKGCGTQQRRVTRPKPEGLKDTMSRNVKIGKKEVSVWRMCLSTCCAVLLLVFGYLFVPTLWRTVSGQISELKDTMDNTAVVEQDDEPEIERIPVDGEVSGETLSLAFKISDEETISDTLYDDNSRELELMVRDMVRMRFIRMEPQDDWVSTHLRMLYPDVSELESFPDTVSISGYTGSRYQISSTTQAEGCVVEFMYVKTPSFDHFFIIEIPTDSFESFESSIDDWMAHLMITDAQTGEELPAAQDASGTDVSESDEY